MLLRDCPNEVFEHLDELTVEIITNTMVEATVREAIKGSDSLLPIPPDPLPWEVGDVYRSVEVVAESRWLGDDMTIWVYRETNPRIIG